MCVDAALPFFAEIVPGTPYTSRIRRRGVASSNPNELWAGLVEKALAKVAVRGDARGYAALQGGSTSLGLAMLFGGRSTVLTVTTPTTYSAVDLATDLAALTSRGHKCGVAWRSGAPPGLVTGHAYPVLRLETVLTDGNTPVTLLQLRNPWGAQDRTLSALCQDNTNAYEWKGDWSDCSPLWDRYPNVAASLQYTPSAQVDGIFWITATDAANSLHTLEVLGYPFCH